MIEQIIITDEDVIKYESETEAVKNNKVFLSLLKEEQEDILQTIIENQYETI